MSDFSDIVAAHTAAVWRTAYRLLAREEDARDCFQETFLAALNVARSQEVRHWRTLLLRIATRRAMDRLRERYRREAPLAGPDELAARHDGGSAPDARARAKELREHVRLALAKLPVQQAEAFWLRHLEGLSPDEIAAALQIEPGHVRVLVHRAALQLRERLGPSYGPESLAEESP